MSKSKYFGKSFITKPVPREGWEGQLLCIGDRSGEENFTPHPGEHFDEALVGLVDTLRVTRKLLVMLSRKLGVRITDPNEFHRNMITGAAKKIGESPEDVRAIIEPIMFQLFQEMVAKLPKKKN